MLAWPMLAAACARAGSAPVSTPAAASTARADGREPATGSSSAIVRYPDPGRCAPLPSPRGCERAYHACAVTWSDASSCVVTEGVALQVFASARPDRPEPEEGPWDPRDAGDAEAPIGGPPVFESPPPDRRTI